MQHVVKTFLVAILFSLSSLTLVQARGAPESFADLAERLMPAVVNISTTQTVSQERAQNNVPPPFQDFFEDFLKRFPQQEGQRPRKVSSLGSGFVIAPDGLIVTNNHVIEGADEIVVNFADGEKYDAKLIGRDPKTDLAVLKIEAKKKFPFVKLGDSQKARVGDWVIAIGNPFGLGGSLSAGVISAIKRDIRSGPYDDFIQTDAAINRGNSGGPLFNMDGDVIGVNSSIISPSGGSVGIGFAIPSDLVQSVVDQLIAYGETRRGWLGVRIQPVTDELAETLGLDKAKGALVSEVMPDGPASKGGVKVGDVIVEFDGKEVETARDLSRIVADTDVEKKVAVVVVRDGKSKKISIVTGRLEAFDKANADETPDTPQSADKTKVAGLELADLDAQTRDKLGLDKSLAGALVEAVDIDSRAYESGIRRGDVITEIDRAPVSSAAKARAAIEAAKAAGQKSVLIYVRNGEGIRFVALKLD
jgi:serine protease Do